MESRVGRQDDLSSRCINALPEVKKVVAGGIAGCVAKTAVAPLSRVTVLMQVQSMRPHKFADGKNPNNQHFVKSLRKMCNEGGIRALWQGNLATCFHRFPYTSITFYANAVIRETLQQSYYASKLPDQSRHLLAGGGAACAAVCTLHPLDVIKTRLMAQTSREYYAGVLDCARKIYIDEGLRGLYRGIGVSLCITTPSIAISFTAFDEFKRLFATWLGPDEPGNFLLTLCSGACAGSTASILMFPMDLVKRQMQMVGVGGRPLVYANVREAIINVFQTGARRNAGSRSISWILGFREFFRGLAPELLKVVPFNALMFSTQNHLISRKWFGEELLYPD